MCGFRRATGAAVVLTFALIVLGAAVRSAGAGLACPDWPRCYGLWLPTPAGLAAIGDVGYSFTQVMLEWFHRLLAGVIVGPLVAFLCVWAIRLRREAPALAPLMAVALVLVLAQAGLGGFTVLARNIPWTVTLHLTVALVFLTVLILVFLVSRRPAGDAAVPDRPTRGPRLAAGLALAVALATLASGAMVAKSGATFACPGWPLCDGAGLADLGDPLVRLNLGHRAAALATALAIAWLYLVGRARRTEAPRFHRDIAAAAALVLAEVALGAAAALLGAPMWVAIAHQAVGVLVFAALAVTFGRPFAHRPRPAHG